MTHSGIEWPEGKRFAFTVFDDTDLATVANTSPVYRLLHDLGFRTTKSVWPLPPDQRAIEADGAIYDFVIDGDTCEDEGYLAWILELQQQGFEIAFHNATYVSSEREFTTKSLDAFRSKFGQHPRAYATHFQCVEGMYWGSGRLSGVNQLVYNVLNRFRTHGVFQGQVPGSRYFWGDLCRDRIDYVRNFIFGDINTLKMCPWMPYRDADREYVNGWFASSEGPDCRSFNRTISESNQDRLEAEGGACIMYTHFANGFWKGEALDPTFERLMRRLADKEGWFVPVSTLLDFLKQQQGGVHPLSRAERRRLERRWLMQKMRVGGTS